MKKNPVGIWFHCEKNIYNKMKNKKYHTIVFLNHPYSHRPYKYNGTEKTYINNNNYNMDINICTKYTIPKSNIKIDTPNTNT